jgi:hypothetical protein
MPARWQTFAQLALDLIGDAALLTCRIDLEAMLLRRPVAAVATISDDPREVDAGKPFRLGDDARRAFPKPRCPDPARNVAMTRPRKVFSVFNDRFARLNCLACA